MVGEKNNLQAVIHLNTAYGGTISEECDSPPRRRRGS